LARLFPDSTVKRLTAAALSHGNRRRNGIARERRPWSCSCLLEKRGRNKTKGFTILSVDQPCMAVQNLALSIRTVMLS